MKKFWDKKIKPAAQVLCQKFVMVGEIEVTIWNG